MQQFLAVSLADDYYRIWQVPTHLHWASDRTDLEFTSIIIIASITGAIASAFTVQSFSLSMHQLDNKRHGLIAHRSSLNCASITRQPQEYLS
ncbi:MAG: hypothetical protein CMQ29_07515 [Gammaproteobacteria bacterium]|nr:hypothetical protein [Gammaproteobacteria bacterium]